MFWALKLALMDTERLKSEITSINIKENIGEMLSKDFFINTIPFISPPCTPLTAIAKPVKKQTIATKNGFKELILAGFRQESVFMAA